MKRSGGLASFAAVCLANLCVIGAASASDGTQSAFDLLFRSDLKLPEGTVLLTAREKGWRYEYRFARGGSAGQAIAICVESGPIMLPAGEDVALRVTSDDVIHTLSIPELGVAIDAIPGRLNERIVKPEKAGRLVAQATIEKGSKTTRRTVDLTVLEPAAYKSWVEKASQTASCASE